MTALAIEFTADAPPPPTPPPTRRHVVWIDADERGVESGVEMLRRHGFEVSRFAAAAEAQPHFERGDTDLVILESALPDADGLALCRQLCEAETAPVILFTVVADTLDRVAGLDFGADDVLAKTTHPVELLARVRALLRRTDRHARAVAAEPARAWRFDVESGFVTAPSGRTVRLSPADSALLRAFAARPGQVLGRGALVSLMHDGATDVGGRSVDARVARLRRTLNDCDGAGDLIKTLRGGGYMFMAGSTEAPA